MRFFKSVIVLALATDVLASTALGKYAYNKWHETELERWLSDHNIPYPAAADRKELVDTVQKNWDDNVVKPYNKWDVKQLTSYLSTQGAKIKKGTEQNKDALMSQVVAAWHWTEDEASSAYESVSDWMFDSWTDSQLKSFLDYHQIPNPSPRTRDSLLSTVRSNYAAAANKIGETAAYPGDWVYSSWSDSDLKAWLDERGLPAPQPSTRDKLVASVRRNAHLASKKAADAAKTASKSAASAQASISDEMFNAYSESQIKAWADKNGLKIPQGSKLNELRAFARNKQSSIQASGASAYGAATSSAGNYFAQATDELYNQGKYYYDYAMNQLGMAGEEAKASFSSVSSVASVSASSLSKQAASSASSLSKAAASASSSASKAASKSGLDASAAGRSAMSSLSASASSAAKVASSSARSASSIAAASASSKAKSAASKAAASTKSAKAEL